MARQEKDRSLRHVWIGIDPGDRWTGIAVLEASSRVGFYHADMTVVDQGERGLYAVANDLADHFATFTPGTRVTMILEGYRVRPVGHQAWNDLAAVRLLGALEMVSQRARIVQDVVTISPGQEPEDLMLPLFKNWITFRNPTWRHARSAWRVILMHLLRDDVGNASAIMDAHRKVVSQARHLNFWQATDALVAPPIHWRIR